MDATNPRAAELDPATERIDVEPVNKAARRALYAKRAKIHPKLVHGTFRRIKWTVMGLTLAVYYLTPWIRWDRGLNAPDQAVLIDLTGQRFYFFFIEIWPQEIYYVTGLLIIAALALFLVTSLAGRVWCGYACPQTVWTDLYVMVERLIEGDRGARIRLDRARWTATKFGRRTAKHTVWLVIALLTGGAWVFYFADAPTLARDLLAFDAPTVAYIAIGILTFTTYMLAGHAREQVCIYMCPWPRIQSAMLDEHSLVVTYGDRRGEPRGAYRKDETWDGRGHCIDCNQCVAACPMGIDIRDGQQLECTTCALCIDACDTVMDRVGLPRGLIGYDTIEGLARPDGGKTRPRLIRARTVLYTSLILVVGAVMLATLGTRADVELTLLRDRNPLFVGLSNGDIRNGYTLKVLNKVHQARRFSLRISGIDGLRLAVPGSDDTSGIDVGPDRLASFRVFVSAPADALDRARTPLHFILAPRGGGAPVTRETVFMGPRR